MNFHDNHKLLFGSTLALFVVLTIGITIIPALHNQATFKPLPNDEPLTESEFAGKLSYIANGCVACHTQQVRNVEMDDVWGKRPSIAADYSGITRTDFLRNTATLMGTERTGPDLTNIGSRQPSRDWHLIHLFNPRAVVKGSIMPNYPWMFVEKREAATGDVVVNVGDEFKRRKNSVVVAKQEALDLVDYLLSLKQVQLPTGAEPEFMVRKSLLRAKASAAESGLVASGPDGGNLFAATCQACHQADGKGLPGAFPSLVGSDIVLQETAETMVGIMMKGYNSRKAQGYPPMPPIAVDSDLDNDEIRAIVNYVRTNWGNSAPEATQEEIDEYVSQHSN